MSNGPEQAKFTDQGREQAKKEQETKRLHDTLAARKAYEKSRQKGEGGERRDKLDQSLEARDTSRRPAGDKSRDLLELTRGLQEASALSLMGYPEWMPKELRLKDGTRMEFSDEDIKILQDFITNVDTHKVAWDQPVLIAGCLFLPNQENREVRWAREEEVSQGYSKYNNCWIYKKGNTLEVRARYPEDRQRVAEVWRLKTGKPMVNLSDETPQPDSRLAEINKSLNQDIERLLETGIPLSEALKTVQHEREEILKVLLMGYIDAFAIFSAYSFMTPQVSKTYTEVKE